MEILYLPDDQGFTVKSKCDKSLNSKIPLEDMLHFGDARLEDPVWGVFGDDETAKNTVRIAKSRSRQNSTISYLNTIKIPDFGVTMLGASHGFDPSGTTTGFIVWQRRRGTLVDPPPHAIDLLNR